MTLKVAHIYACKAKTNSGDFMIGVAYKKYFKEEVLKTNEEIIFKDLDCRNTMLFNINNVNKLNDFDYIVVGGGGLILPDSGPNMTSCWQWIISKECIEKIIKPIYVLSIGYNLFFNQTMDMPSRENSNTKDRIHIFKENIIKLINKAKIFTLRHNDDVEKVLSIVGDEYREKVGYEKCATVWYVNKYWKPLMNKVKDEDKFIAIEIKDDRQWRRYHKIGKGKYYAELKKVIEYLIKNNKKILYLSHDGSRDFFNYLLNQGVNIPYLANNCYNEAKIRDNYEKIHTIMCSAGHSQMIGNGCGVKIISLVTHPKIRNYCDDIGNEDFVDVNNLVKDGEVSDRIISLLGN